MGGGGVKTFSAVDAFRMEMFQRARFNPIRDMDPDKLTRLLDENDLGYLRGFAMTAEAIEQRDDVIRCVASKRKKAAARNGWEILAVDDSAEAKAQKEALEFFYNNMAVTNAFDLNERGSVKLLIRQMMDAVGKKYAVHEIIWDLRNAGSKQVTAELRFVPLIFFENTKGRLRFLKTEGQTEGEELEPNGWMITVGEGLMVACAIAWLYKNMPLKDWIIYSQRHGIPPVHGKTAAARDSKEWDEMVKAVDAFMNELAIVTSTGEEVGLIETKGGTGNLPFPELVERCDRALVRLWRGADLGTISQDAEGSGASLQGEETDVLEMDDAEMISETLNLYLDKPLIAHLFGPQAKCLAYMRVLTSQKQDVERDLKIDEFLVRHGVPVGVEDVLERYNRPMPDAGADLLQAPKQGEGETADDAEGADKKKGRGRLENVRMKDRATLVLIENARPLLAKAQSVALSPLRKRIEDVLRLENEVAQNNALRALQADLPLLLKQINRDPGTQALLENVFGAAAINGWLTAAVERGGNHE